MIDMSRNISRYGRGQGVVGIRRSAKLSEDVFRHNQPFRGSSEALDHKMGDNLESPETTSQSAGIVSQNESLCLNDLKFP